MLLGWLDLQTSKFHDWKKRYGKVEEHNGKIPRDFWLEDWERQAILDFHDRHPLEGYRRLTFMMLDDDVVAVSPSSVYRVLKAAGRLDRRTWAPSKKGTGFVQPLAAHLGHADRGSASGIRTAAPLRLLHQIAGSGIAPLHEKAGQRAMNALAVVEAALHQRDDVGHGFGRVVLKGLHLERALRRVDDDDRTGTCLGHGLSRKQQDGGGHHNGAHHHAFEVRVTPTCPQCSRIRQLPQRGNTGRQTFWPQVTR